MQQPSTAVIEVRELSHLTLETVSLAVTAGERVAIVGESGAGKSLLLSCLLGFVRPTRGEVRVFGKRVDGRSLSAPGLGVAFQQPGLFDAWSVARNLRLASKTPLSDEELAVWLRSIGLDDVEIHARPNDLSGGQQKRVALARALLRGSRLVILDEPTSGLDPENVRLVSSLLAPRGGGHKPALLMVTHDYGLALDTCTRIIRLSDGRIRDVTPEPTLARADAERLIGSHESFPIAPSLVATRTRAPAWGFTPLMLDFAARSLPLSLAVMALLGAMLVAQGRGAASIDVSRFVPQMVVIAVFRELAPLVVGLLMASRVGARMSAQLAGMAYTSQLDSMRALGLSPIRLLLWPFAASAAVAFPVAILAGAGAAIFAASQSAGLAWGGLTIGSRRFLDLAGDALSMDLFVSCFLKGVLMGLAVTFVAYRSSTTRIRSAPDLGHAVTAAAVQGAVAVVLIDIVVSWAFFTRSTR